jgi:FOG: Ankyrin repeat
VERGDLRAASAAVERGADINQRTRIGSTPLFVAVAGGHREIVGMLLSKGAKLNARFDHETPLHWACQKGDREIAEMLVASGADVNAKRLDLKTPLHMALDEQSSFLRPWTPVQAQGHRSTAEMLIAKGADINARDKSGITPLHLACRNGNRESASRLIAAGADVNAKTKNLDTPLHFVANGLTSSSAKALNSTQAEDYLGIAELLIGKGADVNAKGDRGWTALSISSGGPLAQLLKAHGAGGWTPLLLACRANQVESVASLLKAGADVNRANDAGVTALFVAAGEGNLEMARLLVSAGADVKARDDYGHSTLHAATVVSRGSERARILAKIEIAKMLINKGVGIDTVDESGNSSLNLLLALGAERSAGTPIPKGDDEIAMFLISNGANFRLANQDEDTPCYWAKTNDHPRIVELLMARGARDLDFLPSAKRINEMTDRVKAAMRLIQEGVP